MDALHPPGDGPLLVINGVTPELSVTCGRPGGQVVHRLSPATGHSAEFLAPLIAEVLDAAGFCAASLGGVACVRGPGSFTGIRVALATTLGLSFGANVPMAGLDFLPLLAASAARHATGVIMPITYARSGQVYLQAFLADGEVMPMGPPEALFLPEAAARVAEAAAVGPLWLVGEGSSRHRDVLAAAAPLATILGPAGHAAAPEVVLEAALCAVYGFDPIAPLYLRASDAEENLAALAALRGLTLETAQERVRQAVADD
jgi:tRNA threonylcarbamoyladenosine biosynthesis protein TsaB